MTDIAGNETEKWRRLTADADVTVGVVTGKDPPHITIRCGRWRLILTPDEAIALATEIAGAVEKLRAIQPKEQQ